jgi:hypothetical protein
MIPLVFERFALRIVDEVEQRVEFVPLGPGEAPENEVLSQLDTDDCGFGMECEQGHDGGRGAVYRERGV